MQFLLLFSFIVGILALLALYAVKVGIHVQLIKIEKKKDKGRIVDLFFFDWMDPNERALRGKALLMYPLLFPVEFEDREPEGIHEVKKAIKRINMAIYALLILLLLLVIYTAKAYPNGLF